MSVVTRIFGLLLLAITIQSIFSAVQSMFPLLFR